MFSHSISRMLDTSPLSIPWDTDVSHLSPKADRLVLPLANQLGPHVDLAKLAARFAKVPIPMVGLGLGAQGPITGILADSIPNGSWEWLKALASKAPSSKPNIALRGAATLEVISNKGLGDHCVVIGCPSNFLHPSATLGREIARRRANGLNRVVVAAGNPFLPQFRKLEQSLVAMVVQTDGMYVCQHPIDMLRLVKQEFAQISRANFLLYKDFTHPWLNDDDYLAWFRRYAHSFSSVPEWLSCMQGYDLVVGTRIHGVMAGIQGGVPAVCLCIDSRTLELCRTMAIPYLDANDFRDGISLEEITEHLRKWDWRLYDETRRDLAERVTSFIRDNDLEPRNALVEILKSRSKATNAYRAKPENLEAHQVSTASFDDRYPSIFSGIQRSLDSQNPKILSFGCSDGYETNDLASKHFHHAQIVGCDVDDDALRIALSQNRHPSRVSIIRSDPDELKQLAPFDAVVSMAVLCRWPDTREMDDISKIYPFSKFSDSIDLLVSLLRPNGILCIYNANYRVVDTERVADLEVVDVPGLIPKTQPVRLFDQTGKPLADQKTSGVLFRKRPPASEKEPQR